MRDVSASSVCDESDLTESLNIQEEKRKKREREQNESEVFSAAGGGGGGGVPVEPFTLSKSLIVGLEVSELCSGKHIVRYFDNETLISCVPSAGGEEEEEREI